MTAEETVPESFLRNEHGECMGYKLGVYPPALLPPIALILTWPISCDRGRCSNTNKECSAPSEADSDALLQPGPAHDLLTTATSQRWGSASSMAHRRSSHSMNRTGPLPWLPLAWNMRFGGQGFASVHWSSWYRCGHVMMIDEAVVKW